MQAIAGAAVGEGLAGVGGVVQRRAGDGLDAAGGEEVAHPGRARRMHGKLAERGQEHLRPLAGPGHDARRRRRAARSNGSARRRGGSGVTDVPPLTTGSAGGDAAHLHAVVGQHRERRDARQLERGPLAMSRRAPRRPCAISPWMNPLSSARAMPPLASISWNSAQACLGEVVGQLLDVPGAVRRDRSRGRARFPPAAPGGCCGRCGGRTRRACPAPR